MLEVFKLRCKKEIQINFLEVFIVLKYAENKNSTL